jgi:pyruvate kinase
MAMLCDVDELRDLPLPADAARALRELLDDLSSRPDPVGLDAVHDEHREGASNLADYLSFRHRDLRALQRELALLGVSSLGRAEAHVRATIGAALRACTALAGDTPPTVDDAGFDTGPRRLRAHATALLGPERPERAVRIMVTLPTDAAHDSSLVEQLLDAGMDCARINTTHDGPDEWHSMIGNVRKAALATGRPCTVLADLGGPKLRTGPIADGPRVVRIRPTKDPIGRTERPGTAVLVRAGCAIGEPGVGAIPVEGDLLEGVADGDEITVEEARGRRRTLRVVDAGPDTVTVEALRTTWLESGAQLHRAATARRPRATGVVGSLPHRSAALRLAEGDVLILTADAVPVDVPMAGQVARIGCTLREALRALQVGHRVELDDGTIGGEVVAVDHEAGEVTVHITRAPARGAKLGAEKGINLPDTEIDVPALAPDDLAALDAIGGEVDSIGLSFVRRPADVHALFDALDARGLDVGVVLKIETPEAFARLPELLVAGMHTPRLGVMIARGDLAVEAGFERTAELQEEMLWACEAAHVPAIWATQVLESLAKEGQPSRAEITDAAMATRAECVMLNKGPHIVAAVSALDDILRRMSEHQHKKSPLLRALHSWSNAT